MRQKILSERWGRRAARALTLGVSLGALSACDDLLDVELTHLLTEEAIAGAETAQLQVMSAIALFECGSSAFAWPMLGNEDVLESIAGVASGAHVWRVTPGTGTCDTASTTQNWFDQFMGARTLISTDPAKLAPTGKGYVSNYLVGVEGAAEGVYDKLTDGRYPLGAPGERLAAIAAVYMGAVLGHFGQFYCEGALDLSEPITPDGFLAMAEDWLTNRALGHIASYGDFALPNGAAPSAQNTALALRSQTRWARGNLVGADADAATVLAADPLFTFWVTREGGEQRRNKTRHSATEVRFSGMLGRINWWNPSQRAPNPATGELWTDPIPFTGYIFLGVGPEGETFETGHLPLNWAQSARDASGNPVPLANGAVADTRVPHLFGNVQGPGLRENPEYYSSDSEDEPYASWRELTLIRAEYARSLGDLAGAIGFVNVLRTFHGLPTISGAHEAALLADTDEVRAMLLEERRRELFSQSARYLATKIQNTDLLWFPRAQGGTPFQGYNLQGGVRLGFPADEYTQNPNFAALGDIGTVRGSMCGEGQRPRY